MKNITTYVGVDAHKKDLFIAMLIGNERTPVTWTVPNEPQRGAAVGAQARARGPGARARVLRSRAVRLRVATADDDGAGELPGDRAGAHPAETRRADQDESPRCAQAGRAPAGRAADGGAAADAGRGSRPRSVSRAR